MRTLTSEEKVSLEKLVDHTSLGAILEALSEICYLKAEHVQGNWLEADLARKWERAGNKLAVDAIKNIITSLP